MARPRLILVTGPPGSGKTTLARRLADDLGWPMVSRDAIKQAQQARPAPNLSASADQATNTVFRAVLALYAAHGVDSVAEAAFQHGVWSVLLAALVDDVDLRLIRCVVTDAVAAARITARSGRPERAAHDDANAIAPSGFQPYEWSGPVLSVDTTDGYRPDWPQITAFASG